MESQFEQFKLNCFGVKISGAGEGMLSTQGERAEAKFSGGGELLSTSHSEDSTSSSPTCISFLILCARGGRFEGDEAPGESKVRFLALGVLTGKTATVCWRCTEASAACRREPLLGGEEKVLPRRPCVTLSGDNFCVALRKV